VRMGGRVGGKVSVCTLEDAKKATPPATIAVIQVSALTMHAVLWAAAWRANINKALGDVYNYM